MAIALTNEVLTSYEDLGSGVPVLFIHGGYGGAASTILPATPAVIREALPGDRFRVITYDRRSCGQSQYTPHDYTLEDLALDAAALLDQAGIERAIVVGSSAGGPIALQFALNWQERTIALCLPNTGPNLMNESRAVSRRRQELVSRIIVEGARTVFESQKQDLRTPPAPQTQPGEEEAQARHQALLKALATLPDSVLFFYWAGEVKNYAAYVGFDFAPRLGELKMPVCIIHGTADQTVPFDWGLELHHGIPGSEFHAIEGGRHSILSNPAAAEVLRDWASRIASGVAA